MGVVVHVEIVVGSADQMQPLINDRLEQVPRWDLPLGVCGYPEHANLEPNGSEWLAIISYVCEEPDPVYEPGVDTEAAYVPPAPADDKYAVGTMVRDVHHPRIDWEA